MTRHSHLSWIYLTLSLLVFSYVAARTWRLDATYDEVWTITEYLPLTYWEILSREPCNSNNHILNSLLIKLFDSVLHGRIAGLHGLVIARLPNLIAFALYLTFAFKTARRFFPPITGLLFFVLSWCNPFLLDFFGLARGYGLALGFMMPALYFLLRFRERLSLRCAALSLAFSLCSVLSNLPFLNVYLAIAGLVFLFPFIKNKTRQPDLKLLGILFFFSFALFAILYEPVRKMLAGGDLYYGGYVGFYHDTLHSLTKASLGRPFQEEGFPLQLNLFLAALALLVILGWQRVPKLPAFALFCTAILAIPILSSLLQHWWLGNLFLIGRTALFYFPLFILVMAAWAGNATSAAIPNIILSLVVAGLVVNLAQNANFYKTINWPHDSRTSEVVERLKYEAGQTGKTAKLDASWPCENSLRYALTIKDTFPKIEYSGRERHRLEPAATHFLYYGQTLHRVGYYPRELAIDSLPKDTLLHFPDDNLTLFVLR